MGTLQELGLALLAAFVALGAALSGLSAPGEAEAPDCHRPAELARGERVLLVCLEQEGAWVRAKEALADGCVIEEAGVGERVTLEKDCRTRRSDIPGARRLVLGLKIDLNRAGVEDLAALAGIGPALARRIVERRNEHGPFSDPEDILEVPGIGPKRLAAIRPFVETGAAVLRVQLHE